MTRNVADQVAEFDKYAVQAHNFVYQICGADHESIIYAARRRLIAGSELYGDRMWRKLEDDLRNEIREELADAVNYACPIVKHAREAQAKALGLA